GPAASAAASTAAARAAAAVIPRAGGEDDTDPGAAGLDLRSRPQKLLDGLVGACKAALASGGLPAAGGLRPQVMVTIDYRALLERLGNTGTARTASHTGTLNTGTLLFTGPVTAATVRKIACDADIIPVLLGTGAGSWTSAGPHGSSRPTSARPSPPGTRAAPSPAAPSPRPG
uniref:DUF222 domain-containing protein n=1 Tax=Pseudarthrobacter albicanus TaxID=2823873 RepID=UPI003557F4C1